VHGICGNFFLDRETGETMMMNDASYLRADTILSALSRAGARVAVVTAKDKLRKLLGNGVSGTCVSIEARGTEVYSAALSEQTLAEGARLLAADAPDLMYLSTSDFVQHKHAPGDAEANRFYGALDRSLAEIDRLGATLVVTADHGMRAKADAAGQARVIYLQDLVDEWLGAGNARVVLPITDPYVLHHGALGACAMIYLADPNQAPELAHRVQALAAIDLSLVGDEACRRFNLPADRAGDLVVFSDGEHVIGTRPADHDLSALDAPLRSHGGRAEQEVPMFTNRPVSDGHRPRHNYDAFDVALNGCV
jgi:phosphonoacetate hydrolase